MLGLKHVLWIQTFKGDGRMSLFNSIGTDTELFATDKDGKLISLCGKIGGTKAEPAPIKDYPPGFSLQEDNVSVEFNIPPVRSPDAWVQNISAMMRHIRSVRLKPLGLSVYTGASANFTDDELTHPQALVFGCEPDFNAWTGEPNEKPFCSNFQLRTAGGHVHVGTENNMVDAVKLMDLYLGVPSVLLDSSPSSMERKKLYGKAGAMRPKPYGFEYRVLSNFWVFSSELMRWVYENTRIAMVKPDVKITKSLSQAIQDCINTNNTKVAADMIESFRIPMPVLKGTT